MMLRTAAIVALCASAAQAELRIETDLTGDGQADIAALELDDATGSAVLQIWVAPAGPTDLPSAESGEVAGFYMQDFTKQSLSVEDGELSVEAFIPGHDPMLTRVRIAHRDGGFHVVGFAREVFGMATSSDSDRGPLDFSCDVAIEPAIALADWTSWMEPEDCDWVN